MAKLMTVPKAKEEIKRLQQYIELAESYETDTLDKQIIKEYAFTNSIAEVTKKLNIDREYVITVLKRKGSDELHKMIRSWYLLKTRPNRNR